LAEVIVEGVPEQGIGPKGLEVESLSLRHLFLEFPSLAESSWFVYLLKCSDDSFYTGIAQDVEERLHRHQTSRGAEYTKARLPVELVYVEAVENDSKAVFREKWLKRQTRQVKEELMRVWQASPNRG